MRSCTFTLLLFIAPLLLPAQANHVLISQVYGGGGNTGALYKNDFVELYNPTPSPVDLTGWTLLYAGSTAANWTPKMSLSGTIQPRSYFLIQLKSNGTIGSNLPDPDNSFATDLSATGGKLLLLNADAVFTNTTCPLSATIVDKLGYGTTANCSETAPAPAPSNSTALFRKESGCTDGDNNSTDFYELAPWPRNSKSAGHDCGGSLSITGLSASLFCVNAAAGADALVHFTASGSFSTTLHVYLSDANGSFGLGHLIGTQAISGTNPSGSIPVTIPANAPSGTAYRIRVDALSPSAYGNPSAAVEVINGAKNAASLRAFPDHGQMTLKWVPPAGCYDEVMVVCKQGAFTAAFPEGDGSSYTAAPSFTGSGSVFDGGKVVYKGGENSVEVLGLEDGQSYSFKVFTRRGSNWSPGTAVSAQPRWAPAPGEVLINQFSPGYGAASDEYFELVNVTDKTFDLSDLFFSYQGPTGVGRVPSGLSGLLPPHSYWLLTPAAAATTVGKTTQLPADGSSGSAVAANAYLALTRKSNDAVVDAVAYGAVSGGSYIEGAAAPAPPPGGGLRRVRDGVDNNDNAADFVPVAHAEIDLRNSSSRLAGTNAVIPGGTYARLYVTGNASIGGPVTLTEKLELGSGTLDLNDHNLTTASVTNGSPVSYVRTNGSGMLTIKNIGPAAVLFPVGNSTYNPLTLQNGSGQDWSLRLQDGVEALHADKAILRTWHVLPAAAPAEDATLEFHYNEGDPSQTPPAYDNTEAVQVWNKQNGGWQKSGTAHIAAGVPGGWRTATVTGLTAAGTFAVASASAVLPVRFGTVKAFSRQSDVVISWSNSTEQYITSYEVERSADGRYFLPLASLQPLRNDGSAATYTYTDKQPLTGAAFYRIKATEENRRAVYSPVVRTLFASARQELLVSPNPVRGRQLHFSLAQAPIGLYRITLYDASGKAVQQQLLRHEGGSIAQAWVLSELKSGTYLLQASGPVQLRTKIVVQ